MMPRDHQKAVCGVCGGPITFYARMKADPPPRTSSVDDSTRWAHDQCDSALWDQPHRAQPKLLVA